MLCNIFKEKENMRTRKLTYLKKKKKKEKTAKENKQTEVVLYMLCLLQMS